MNNTARKIVVAILLLLLGAQFIHYSSQIRMQNAVITELKIRMEEIEFKYADQIKELYSYKVKSEEQQRYISEREEKGLDLIERMSGIKSLKELLDMYQPLMDGAISEGYGSKLAALTQKEGLGKLIQMLYEKEESIIENVTFLLMGEYVIAGQSEEIDSVINELKAMDLNSMDIKHRGIVLNLLSEAYFAESRINGI